MANYVKPGLVYYPTYTNRYQDSRIRKLKRQMGAKAVAVYDFVLCEIYRTNGYFIEWDQDGIMIEVADYYNFSLKYIEEVINYCCHLGLFNRELKASRSILTSIEVQEQYIFICKVSRRKLATIEPELNLIPDSKMEEFEENFEEKEPEPVSVFDKETTGFPDSEGEKMPQTSKNVQLSPIIVQQLPKDVADLKQRKEKERKGKKTELNIFSSFTSFFDGLDPEFSPVFEDWVIYKHERGEPYLKLPALKSCYTRIIRESGGCPETASDMIYTAIFNKWAGFFFKKNPQKTEINIPFEEFWNIYDKKTADPDKCKAKWERLSDTEREKAMAYIPEYKKAQPDKVFRKNPDTFINNKGWTHELIYSSKSKKNTNYSEKSSKDERF